MLAQAHGYPGSSPAGRSTVVLHPNASHGLAPPYDAAPARRHGLGLSDLPEVAALIHGELGQDHILLDRRGEPVLIDIEGAM